MTIDHEPLWPELKALAESGNTAGLLARIRSVHDDAERISLFRFAIRKLAFEPWANPNLDIMTELADTAIADCERIGGAYFQEANQICYNTSANLADCWADGRPREPRHFEKGLEYARKALAYRDRLGKGPGPKAMAWWAVGKHHQSLGQLQDARMAYETSLGFERQAAAESGKPAAISPEAPPGYLIAAGNLALLDGDSKTAEQVREALRQMEARGGEAKEEAGIVLGQLRETARLMGSSLGKALR